MSGRGRRAVLPPSVHRFDPGLARGGMIVTVVNKGGHKKTFDFARLPAPESMQRSLAACFALMCSRWTYHGSARSCWDAMRVFVLFLNGLESPPVDLDGVSGAMLKRWRASQIGSPSGNARVRYVRSLLQLDPRLSAGPVAEELARRIPRPSSARQSYAEAERTEVVLAAQRQFRSAWLWISENTRLLDAWRNGDLAEGSDEWLIGDNLDHLARTGDVHRTHYPSGQTGVTHRRLLGARARNAWGRLFLTRMDVTALAVLMTDRFGWNQAVFRRMPTPTALPSLGESSTITYQVTLEKRRSGDGRWFSTENITDSGADSPGRLITQALQATAHGRALAAELEEGTDLLMVSRSAFPERMHQDTDRPEPVGPLGFGICDDDANRWAKMHGLPGSPFQRTRRTTVTRERRPLQHTPGTHESVYVLPDQRVQRSSQEVFEAGAREALEQAEDVVFAGQIVEAPQGGCQQTATVDCSDEATSPWPAPDGGCGAEFLLCLGCPNASVHPGHHGRLALLDRHLRSLRSVLDDRSWSERWDVHALRLEDLRKRVGDAAWNASLARVGAEDRAVVQLLVKGDLAP